MITTCYFVRTPNGLTFSNLVAPPQGGYNSFDCIHGFFQMFICQCDYCVVIKALFFLVDLCLGYDVS